MLFDLKRLYLASVFVLAGCVVAQSPDPEARSLNDQLASLEKRLDSLVNGLQKRHGDEEMAPSGKGHGMSMQHDAHKAAVLEINETQILEHHAPDPLAYYEFDATEEGQSGLLVAHIACMTLAFFVFLPLSLFLKYGKSNYSILPQLVFIATAILGTFFGTLYNGLTPDLYPSSSHTRLGWLLLVLVGALNALDMFHLGVRLVHWFKSADTSNFWGSFTKTLVNSPTGSEEVRDKLYASVDSEPKFVLDDSEGEGEPDATLHDDYSGIYHHPDSSSSSISEDTLLEHVVPQTLVKSPTLRSHIFRILRATHTLLDALSIIFAYVEAVSGTFIYVGFCRGNYGNGCLAHIIKGSIFLWYGLLTFARYCGAFAGLGWAWNRAPRGKRNIWTAEFVESLVIFVYGASNTWLERLGKAGKPYSVKDIQHISIAVMFWFAGLLGMLMESRRVRSWLASGAVIVSGRGINDLVPPASASFSFNPFPALTIGVTGIAMALHHQVYVFQVQIHILWGLFLGLFALFRCLTYFFMYLKPPTSMLPSRPPTEALASLCLACGGFAFILSTEQIGFAAMRHGFDDVMAFANITIAFICIVFTWILVLLLAKNWASRRHASNRRLFEEEVEHDHHTASAISFSSSMRQNRKHPHFGAHSYHMTRPSTSSNRTVVA